LIDTDGYFELIFEPVEVELTISYVHQFLAPTRQLRYDPTRLYSHIININSVIIIIIFTPVIVTIYRPVKL